MIRKNITFLILFVSLGAAGFPYAGADALGPHGFSAEIRGGGTVLVSKDPRFGAGLHIGGRIDAVADFRFPSRFVSVSLAGGYHHFEDSPIVDGVLYRGYSGVHFGPELRLFPFTEPALRSLSLGFAAAGNYSNYTLIDLSFFHVSLTLTPAAEFPLTGSGSLVLTAAAPISWELRRSTAYTFGGALLIGLRYTMPGGRKP